MAIHNQEEVAMGGGVSKGIEASAMRMILENLQESQYQYPIKSTVRELVSNGIDSIAEREIAKKILMGTNKVEDFFVEREGEEYQDSRFDASYYDLKWLSDNETVDLTYIVGSAVERDKVVITDRGVGLGSYRLEKYFSLGYSTKRLSKMLLGKFGIGGKAALSIGEAYYTMESRYNGQLYRFNIYSHTFDSLIPAFNLDTGEKNEHVVFNKGTDKEYLVYYEKTELLNGVEVSVSAKKTHRQQYIDAVRSQLLYFPNVNFFVIEDGDKEEVNFHANILYEDEYIVLSDNQYWSKPHLLLNRVNYGYINFEELELEDKKGNIGIKIAPEDVKINPSRESISWSDKTKKTVLERFNIVVDIASKFIQEQLKDTDYLNWLRACYNITGRAFSEHTIVGRLAKIVDLSSVKPSFIPEPRLRFQQMKVFNGLYVREVMIVEKRVANRLKYQVQRTDRKTMNPGVINLPIYLMTNGERAGNKKDKYLYQLHPRGFLLVMEPLTSREDMTSAGAAPDTVEGMLALLNKEGQEGRANVALTWKYLTESGDVQWYNAITVPDDFTGTDEEVDEEDVIDIRAKQEAEREEKEQKARDERMEKLRIAKLTSTERRKAQGKTLMYTPRASYIHNFNGTLSEPQRAYEWQKLEVKTSELNDWDAEEIYYSAGPEQDPLMHLVAMLTRDVDPNNTIGGPARAKGRSNENEQKYSTGKWMDSINDKAHVIGRDHGIYDSNRAYYCQQFYDSKEIILIKTSLANAKYVQDFQPIQEFFHIVKNKTITMSNILIRWNTARIIKEKLTDAAFLYNFDTFNSKYASLYQRLTAYVDSNYRELADQVGKNFFGLDIATYIDLVKHLDQVQQFQEFVATQPTSDEIAEMAKFMFGTKELTDGHSVDPYMVEMLNKVTAYCTSVGTMLNYVPILTGGWANIAYKPGVYRPKEKIPVNLELEIKTYLEFKGVLDYNNKEMEEFESSLQGQPVEYIVEEEEQGFNTLKTVANPKIGVQIINPSNTNTGLDTITILTADPTENKGLQIPNDQAIIQSF